MRVLIFGSPLSDADFIRWAKENFRQIEMASVEDVEAVLSQFSITGTLTEQRSFDAGTATVDDLRNVLATMVSDIKKRGQKRGYAT